MVGKTAEALPNLISGTPHAGWYEALDNRGYTLIIQSLQRANQVGYHMRTGAEALNFFKLGKVSSRIGPTLDHVCR